MDEDDFKARILAAGPGEIVPLPPGWTIMDFIRWAEEGNLDELLSARVSRLLLKETEIH